VAPPSYLQLGRSALPQELPVEPPLSSCLSAVPPLLRYCRLDALKLVERTFRPSRRAIERHSAALAAHNAAVRRGAAVPRSRPSPAPTVKREFGLVPAAPELNAEG
jgi:hypothetical protein